MKNLFFQYFKKLQFNFDGTQSFFNVFSSNYKRLDHIYQKKFDENSLDERHFLKDRKNTNNSNFRMTPFGRR